MVASGVSVEEADRDAVLIEQRGGKGDTRQDELEVINTRASFFKAHRTTVVGQDDNIEEGKLGEVDGELHRQTPFLGNFLDDTRRCYLGRDHVERSLWVECLNALVLNTLVKGLKDRLGTDGSSCSTRSAARGTGTCSTDRGTKTLLTMLLRLAVLMLALLAVLLRLTILLLLAVLLLLTVLLLRRLAVLRVTRRRALWLRSILLLLWLAILLLLRLAILLLRLTVLLLLAILRLTLWGAVLLLLARAGVSESIKRLHTER